MLLTLNSYLQLGYSFTLFILIGLFFQDWYKYIKSINSIREDSTVCGFTGRHREQIIDLRGDPE